SCPAFPCIATAITMPRKAFSDVQYLSPEKIRPLEVGKNMRKSQEMPLYRLVSCKVGKGRKKSPQIVDGPDDAS
ncbi:MAG: hypothetical protein K2G91_10890, partial [Prevotella sp.]|nr:hypothetical protein [Prevotella sp.]